MDKSRLLRWVEILSGYCRSERGNAVRRKNTDIKECSILPALFKIKSEPPSASEALKEGLSKGVVTDQEELCESNEHYLYTYICQTRTIAEYIDLDVVFDFYCKLGIYAPNDEVCRLCDVEIRQYGAPNAPFVYFGVCTAAEQITTGLLLRYPLESTASILSGY